MAPQHIPVLLSVLLTFGFLPGMDSLILTVEMQ
jgi:hypothetical protein